MPESQNLSNKPFSTPPLSENQKTPLSKTQIDNTQCKQSTHINNDSHSNNQNAAPTAPQAIKYFTTPIYYLNGLPHIGHAYTSIAVDILARFSRMNEIDVIFATGTDEHGMKVAQAAEQAAQTTFSQTLTTPITSTHATSTQTPLIHAALPNITQATSTPSNQTASHQTTSETLESHSITQEFCDKIAALFQSDADNLKVTYDDFVRTTQTRHKKAAQHLWMAIKNYIYKGSYNGWYSTRDEEFIRNEDLINGKAPSGAEVKWIEEECYYFKLSAFGEKLLKHYKDNPNFIMPESRKNEIVSFVNGGLQDLSISRTRFDWGVVVPDDSAHVMYVWIDALANYLTILGYPEDMEKVHKYMPKCNHIIGKEIIRFHAVYWPAFLMAADLPLPEQIFAHGWWTNSGEKMSKSLENVIQPMEIVKKYSLDSLRYYLFSAMTFGQDGDFNEQNFISKINTALANDYGNLVQRVISFINKCDEKSANHSCLSEDGTVMDEDMKFLSRIESFSIDDFMEKKQLDKALDATFLLIYEANKFVEEKKPWQLAKEKKLAELQSTLTILSEAIRHTTYALHPFMPEVTEKVFKIMNIIKDNDVKKSNTKNHTPIVKNQDLKNRLKNLNFNATEILFQKIM